MSRIEKVSIATFGFLILSIPAIYLANTSTKKHTVFVDVLSSSFVPSGVEKRYVPSFTGGKHPKPTHVETYVETSSFWQFNVMIDGEQRTIDLEEKDKKLIAAKKVKITYQYLRDKTFRVIRVEEVNNDEL